jgi:hypothetical protein
VSQLVTEIYLDGRYKSICKQIAKRPDKAEELHSTFILALLEMKEPQQAFLVKMKEASTLEVYCVGIINRIWNSRNRVKSYENGSTSPLFDYSSTLDITPFYGESDESVSPDSFFAPSEEYDLNVDYISKEARKIIDKECDSPVLADMYKARVFKYSYIVHDNPDQFAKSVKIPRASIRSTCYKFRDYLKEKLNK